uniref:Uncharacterized protein n=1 Tax=Lotharella vacuolata TaxID=74820 RepID=A0A0H5BQW4_9EUKA|nr:hypothetical protein [Lotharella vacuolata]BAS01686.1 hypothetical protein [Lotharella vacuolata]BAS01693.1 hypothetical protein [Lotharella vacuolata]
MSYSKTYERYDMQEIQLRKIFTKKDNSFSEKEDSVDDGRLFTLYDDKKNNIKHYHWQNIWKELSGPNSGVYYYFYEKICVLSRAFSYTRYKYLPENDQLFDISLVCITRTKADYMRMRMAINNFISYSNKDRKETSVDAWIDKMTQGYYNDEDIAIHYETALTTESRVRIPLCNFELDLKTVKNINDLFATKISSLINSERNDIKLAVGVLVQNIIVLNNHVENLIAYRANWSIFGSKLATLGKASKRELNVGVYVKIDWCESEDVNLSDIIENLICQKGYWYGIFADINFLVTVRIVTKKKYYFA